MANFAESAKGIGYFKIATFSHLSGTKNFHKILCFIFRGLQSVFLCYDMTVISEFLISIENFCLVEKQNKENFVDSGIVKKCHELDLSRVAF